MEILTRIYENNLFSSKQLAEELDKENNLDPKDEQDSKLGYGEILKDGVDILYQFIKSKFEDESQITFCDVGSGNGKLALHLSVISKFKKIYGLELNQLRIDYANFIIRNSFFKFDNVQFLNSDAKKFDFSDVNVVFMNDVLFDENDKESIISKLKSGTLLISYDKNSLEPEGQIQLPVCWWPTTLPFRYYIIK